MKYTKIIIKSKDDLPEDILLHVGNKKGFEEIIYIEKGETKKPFRYDSNDIPTLRIDDIDWYLFPDKDELESLTEKKSDADLLQDIYDRNGMEIIANSDIYQQGFKDGLNYQPPGSKEQKVEEVGAEEILDRIHNIERMSACMEDSYVLKRTAIRAIHEYAQQSKRKISDILECISKFDDTETLESKGRYFDVIQKDVRNLNQKS